MSRSKIVENIIGKVSDEWFMQLPHKYAVERLELKSKTKTLRQKLSECGQTKETVKPVIYYRFAGYVEIPELSQRQHIKADTRNGVAAEYLTEPLPA